MDALLAFILGGVIGGMLMAIVIANKEDDDE